MAAFTMKLDECIQLHPDDIGLNDYPVINSTQRAELNKLIVDQYINREIGQETFSLFRHAMRRKMAQIMPYYNQLIRSESLIIDPFKTVDVETIGIGSLDSSNLTVANGDTESETETNSNTVNRNNSDSATSGTSRAVSSDLPQTVLSENGAYASQATDGNSTSGAKTSGLDRGESKAKTKAKSEDTNVTDSQSKNTSSDNRRTKGMQGSQMQLLAEYRALFLNVNMMIVNELDSLFMQVWNTPQSYTGAGRLI